MTAFAIFVLIVLLDVWLVRIVRELRRIGNVLEAGALARDIDQERILRRPRK